jgi:hypothetical protein
MIDVRIEVVSRHTFSPYVLVAWQFGLGWFVSHTVLSRRRWLVHHLYGAHLATLPG